MGIHTESVEDNVLASLGAGPWSSAAKAAARAEAAPGKQQCSLEDASPIQNEPLVLDAGDPSSVSSEEEPPDALPHAEDGSTVCYLTSQMSGASHMAQVLEIGGSQTLESEYSKNIHYTNSEFF